jgi:hypothetical protein
MVERQTSNPKVTGSNPVEVNCKAYQPIRPMFHVKLDRLYLKRTNKQNGKTSDYGSEDTWFDSKLPHFEGEKFIKKF